MIFTGKAAIYCMFGNGIFIIGQLFLCRLFVHVYILTISIIYLYIFIVQIFCGCLKIRLDLAIMPVYCVHIRIIVLIC